jgi:hypothetical protein
VTEAKDDFNHLQAKLKPHTEGRQPGPFDKVFVLEGFFSPEQCKKVIKLAEGFASSKRYGWKRNRGKDYPVDIPTKVLQYQTSSA